MSKREGQLKSLLRKELRESGFLLLAYATAGAPDIVAISNRYTSNWEAKHCTPDFRSQGNQELMCMRLAVHSHCRYILWHEDRLGRCKKTMIVHPRQIDDKTLTPESWCEGYNMRWLVEQVRLAHGL